MRTTITILFTIAYLGFSPDLFAQKFYESVLRYLPFNDSIQDYSQYQEDFSPAANDPAVAVDRFGKPAGAVQFDGDTQFIDLGDLSQLRPTFPFSYVAWVYMDSFQAVNSPVYYSNDHKTVYAGANLSITPNGNLTATLGTGTGAGSQFRRTAESVDAIQVQTWHQVAVVYQALNDIRLFIDGVESQVTTSGTGSAFAYNNEPALVGGADNPFVSQLSFPGRIDDLYVIDAPMDSASLTLLSTLRLSLPMDGNGIDYAGASNDGVLTNTTPVKDRFGVDSAAIGFNGLSSEFEIPSDSNYKVQFPFSISLWFRPDTFDFWYLFYNNSHDFNRYRGIWINNVPNGGLSTSYGNNINSGPSGRYTVRNDDTLAANFWHHMVAVFEDNRTASLYVNGQLDTTISFSGTANSIFYDNGPAELGFYRTPFAATAEYFKGDIDELLLWSKALDSFEVSILFTPGLSLVESPSSISDTLGNDVTFSALFYGTGGDISYQWQKYDGSTWNDIPNSNSASLFIPAITYADSGEYRCIAQSFGISDTSEAATLEVLEEVVGFDKFTKLSEAQVYPNPTKSELFVQSSVIVDFIRVSDLLGKTLIEQSWGENGIFKIETDRLETGVYILSLNTNGMTRSIRFMKD